jgi:anti-sigma regulatory factor (Ser/Thr protein kinase)
LPDLRTISIALPGAFGVRQGRLERLIRLLGPLLELEEPACVDVDLSGLVSVSPAALALLTAALRRLADLDLLGDGSVISPPLSAPVRNYLLRMNMIRLLAGEDFKEPFERRAPSGFRPCEHFTDAKDYPKVAKHLTEALTERCQTDNIAEASIRIALDEIAENVVHHADSSIGGFAAAQGWRKNQEFEIAIVDLGIGVRGSLTKNPAHADIADDATAITRALQPRVSATPERNAGIGLFITKLLLEANGGLLLVRSGHGSVQAGVVDDTRLESASLPGTLVALRARTDRVLDINSVYEHLASEHPVDNDDD